MSNNLCKYKNILGESDKGFHTHILGFALFDLLVTIVAAFLMMLYVRKFITNISNSLLFGIILLILLLLAEYLHKLFCII